MDAVPPTRGASDAGHKDPLKPTRRVPAPLMYPERRAVAIRGRAGSPVSKSSRNLDGDRTSFRMSLRVAPIGWFHRPCLSGGLERTRSLIALRVRSHAADCPYGNIQEPRWSRTYKNVAPRLVAREALYRFAGGRGAADYQRIAAEWLTNRAVRALQSYKTPGKPWSRLRESNS